MVNRKLSGKFKEKYAQTFLRALGPWNPKLKVVSFSKLCVQLLTWVSDIANFIAKSVLYIKKFPFHPYFNFMPR